MSAHQYYIDPKYERENVFSSNYFADKKNIVQLYNSNFNDDENQDKRIYGRFMKNQFSHSPFNGSYLSSSISLNQKHNSNNHNLNTPNSPKFINQNDKLEFFPFKGLKNLGNTCYLFIH